MVLSIDDLEIIPFCEYEDHDRSLMLGKCSTTELFPQSGMLY